MIWSPGCVLSIRVESADIGAPRRLLKRSDARERVVYQPVSSQDFKPGSSFLLAFGRQGQEESQ